MSPFLLKNKNGQPSITTTLTVVGFFIINIKLLFSGIDIADKFKMDHFSGTEYAAALAAIGGLHVYNKKINTDSNKSDSSKDNS